MEAYVDPRNECNESTDGCNFDSVRVFEHTGTKIYKYFQPDELYHTSLTSRRVYNHISQHLIHVLKQNLHLPLMIDLPPPPLTRMMSLDEGLRERLRVWGGYRPRTQATITSGKLFPTRESLVNYIVQIILLGSELRAVGTGTYTISDTNDQTQEETINIVREGLNAGCRMTLELSTKAGSIRLQPNGRKLFYGPNGRFNDEIQAEVGEGLLVCDHTNIENRIAKDMVECYFCGSHGYKSFAKSWLLYILSQPGTNVSLIQCIFIHPNQIESVTTEGLIISNSGGMSVTVRFKRRM